MTRTLSRGKQIEEKLQKALRAYSNGVVEGTRDRPIIWGISTSGAFVGGQTLAGFLAQAGRILRDSGRVYRWEETLVYECRDVDGGRLEVLATGKKVESGAASILVNLFGVGVQGDKGNTESLPPAHLINALLADEDLRRQLPAIRHYAHRPIFDPNFNLCGPGWNAEQGILIHGPDITPVLEAPTYAPNAPVLDRLPRYLRRLLQGFCWASDADLVNAVALFLTGLLSNYFVECGKPIALLDGNQPNVGKTLLCQVLGRVLDDVEPARLPLVGDEELEKRLCAQLRSNRSSLFFFDNLRTRIDSPLIEQNALSPLLSFRVLGQSQNVSRPNAFLWLVTSNSTAGTEDLINRSMPIRLRYEGDPRERTFTDDLLEYASRYRLEILGELAGLVLRWKQAGMPLGQQRHRCLRWAQTLDGILRVAGLEGFLGNIEEAEAAMDEGLQALATLAEYALASDRSAFYGLSGTDLESKGQKPGQWVALLQQADVYTELLAHRNSKARESYVGTFLSGKVNRSVEINTARGSGRATLRVRQKRARTRLYFFEVTLGEVEGADSASSTGVNNRGTSGAVGGGPSIPEVIQTPILVSVAGPGVNGQRSFATIAGEEKRSGNDLQWT